MSKELYNYIIFNLKDEVQKLAMKQDMKNLVYDEELKELRSRVKELEEEKRQMEALVRNLVGTDNSLSARNIVSLIMNAVNLVVIFGVSF